MPRFYLQLRDGTNETLDPEGIECADSGSLAAAMLRNARDIISGDAKAGVIDFRLRIDAEDEGGAVVQSLPFADAVRLLRTA